MRRSFKHPKTSLVTTQPVQSNEQIVPVQPIVRAIPIKTSIPSIMIAQNGVIGCPTIHNVAGVCIEDIIKNNENINEYGYQLLSSLDQKIMFHVIDIAMSCLNTCINRGLIDKDIVDLSDFDQLRVYLRGIGASPRSLQLECIYICQVIYNILYKYATFAKRNDGETSINLVAELNNIVANVSNLILHHLSRYIDERASLLAMLRNNPDYLSDIGRLIEDYKNANIVGELFLSEKELNYTNSMIAQSIEIDNESTIPVDYTFSPSKREPYDDF